MTDNHSLVPYQGPQAPAMVRFTKPIERKLTVSSQKLIAGKHLVELTSQQHSQAISSLITSAAQSFSQNQQLIEQSGVPKDVADALQTVNHNAQMALLNRAEGVNQLFDYLLKESLKVLLVPDAEWEERTIAMKLKNLATWGEEELWRKYQIRLPWWQSVLNAATLGTIADAKRRRIEQVMGNGNGFTPYSP